MRSILQNWVMSLPLREQGVLLAGVRGCDLAPKYPLDSLERQMTAFLRYCVLVPADEREIDIPGAFFKSRVTGDWSVSQLGHYPLHWVMHIMHAFQVVGYRHPNPRMAAEGIEVYVKIVQSLHLNVEDFHEMVMRLSEDRIESGTVVS